MVTRRIGDRIFSCIFENSNMEYQSFLQGGAHPNGRSASVHPPFFVEKIDICYFRDLVFRTCRICFFFSASFLIVIFTFFLPLS